MNSEKIQGSIMHSKKTNQSGFSFVEVVAAMGLGGVIIFGGMTIMKTIAKNKKITEFKMHQKLEQSEILSQLKKLQNVSWGVYDSTQSYYLNNSSSAITNWSLAEQGITAITDIEVSILGEKIIRSSHDLELTSASNQRELIFTRCIDRDYEFKEFNYAEALALPKIPLYAFQGNRLLVYCCDKKDTKVCKEEVKDSSSKYTVRTFYKSESDFKTFPLLPNRDLIESSSFMMYFNSLNKPSSYEIYLVNQTKKCFMDKAQKNCTGTYISNFTKIGGAVKFQGVNDNGILQIR